MSDQPSKEKMGVDSLTGLPTRRDFQKIFHDAVETAKKENQQLAFCFIDIDHFLEVNEKYGHDGGDHVLVTVGQVVRETVGALGECSRFGGDEFAILFSDMGRERAFLLVEKIREKIEGIDSFGTGVGSFTGKITISAGVSAFPVDGRTDYALLRKANEALFRCKRESRNTIRLAVEENMVAKTAHFTQTQLNRLSEMAAEHSVSEAELLREAVDDLIIKYDHPDILSS